MPLRHDLLPLAGFVALMAIAAFEDFRRLVIPNGVVVGLCVLWPVHLATAPGGTLVAGMTAIGCGFAIFFAGALLFSRGLIGGGDVKLFAVAALWAGLARSCRFSRSPVSSAACWVCSHYRRFVSISPGWRRRPRMGPSKSQRTAGARRWSPTASRSPPPP